MVESASELSAKADVEDLVRNEKKDRALQESEERYRLLFEQSPIGISITTMDGDIIDANKTLCAIVGYSEDELKRIHVSDLYEKPERRNALLEAVKRDGALSGFSARLKRKDGALFDALLSISEVRIGGKSLLQTTIQDVTERRKIEETLRQSEEKYRNLFENARDTILTYGPKGIISSVNRRVEDFGFRKDQLIGKNMLRFIPKKYWPRLIKEHSDIARGNHTEGEIEVITPMGKIEVEYRSNPVRQGEKVIGAQTIMRDITERKREEEAIRASEEKFRTVFENVNDVIVYVDKHGKILDVNERSTEVFGYSKDEVIGKNFLRAGFLRLRDIPKIAKTFKDILISGTVSSVLQLEVKHKNGNTVPVEVSTRILKKNDKIEGFLTLVRDITERKKAELALLESQEEFEGLFMKSPEALAHTDPRFGILDINPRFTELFGYSREEARAKNLDSLIVPSDRMEEAEGLGKRAVEGHVYHDTVRKTKQGALVPVSVSAAPVVVKGELTGYVAVYKDISHLKRAEEALTTMNEKLRVVGGLTRHDARNRLSLLTTYVYLVKERLAGDDEVKNYLEKVEGAVKDVVGIFDFAKVYEMLGVEKPAYLDVEKTVNEAVSFFPALEKVRVIIDCHGLAVLADSLLRQAFYNLIDDSLKYAQHLTQIKVYYERMDNDHLRLVYEDNGVGIPFDKKSMLFQRGYTSGKGSGYGLYLIQKMMEIYGWTIQEIGEPGKGVRFVMEIPKLNKEGKELYCLNAKI